MQTSQDKCHIHKFTTISDDLIRLFWLHCSVNYVITHPDRLSNIMMGRSNMQEFSVIKLAKIELYEQNIIHQNTNMCCH